MLVRGSFHSRDEGSGDKVVTRCHPTMWMGFVPLSCTLKTGQTVKGYVLPTLKRTHAPPRTYTRELHASVRGRSREGRSCSSGPQAHTHAWSGMHGVARRPHAHLSMAASCSCVASTCLHSALRSCSSRASQWACSPRTLASSARSCSAWASFTAASAASFSLARRSSSSCLQDGVDAAAPAGHPMTPDPPRSGPQPDAGSFLQAGGCVVTTVAATCSFARHSSHRTPTQQFFRLGPWPPCRAHSPAEERPEAAPAAARL